MKAVLQRVKGACVHGELVDRFSPNALVCEPMAYTNGSDRTGLPLARQSMGSSCQVSGRAS